MSATPPQETPSPPAATPDAPSDAPKLHRAGSLTYTGKRLAALFGALLTADVVLTLIERVEAKILPVVLKSFEASDQQIAIVASSIPALLQLLVAPVVSYRSDRKRTRRGRRIPYILWATPIMAIFLAATPFAPEIGAWLVGSERIASWMEALPWAPTMLTFAMLTIGFRFGHIVLVTMFFSLFRDVVPSSHMGRFLALFRAVGALSTFVTAYWLLGIAVSHAREIFVGLATLNLLGFFGICIFVKEGEYPPVEDDPATAKESWGKGVFNVCRTFVRESYSHPIYRWTYLARLPIFASVPISGFIVFFPQRELGMDLDAVGKMMAWPAIAWILVAYPVGRWFDRFGTIRVMKPALVLITLAYALSFFGVVGEKTFFVSTFVTGILFWVVMLGQLALAQEVFHRDRYAQLSSASIIIHSIGIAFVFSPFAGWALDAMRDLHLQVVVPFVGEVEIGRYRFVNLMLAGLFGMSFFSLLFVSRWWRRLGGGQNAYEAPL